MFVISVVDHTLKLDPDPKFWPNLDPDPDPGPDLFLNYKTIMATAELV